MSRMAVFRTFKKSYGRSFAFGISCLWQEIPREALANPLDYLKRSKVFVVSVLLPGAAGFVVEREALANSFDLKYISFTEVRGI